MDVALKGRRVSSRMFGVLGMYTSRMNRLGTASGAGAFHRPPLYTSSKHLKNPPPNPTQVAVAFANSDRCLEDGDAGRGGGIGVGHHSRDRGRWLWQAGSAWRNDRCRPPDTRQWMGVRGSKRQRAPARGWRLLWQSRAGAQEWAATRWRQAGYRARMSREQAGGGDEGQMAGTVGSNNQATGRRRHRQGNGDAGRWQKRRQGDRQQPGWLCWGLTRQRNRGTGHRHGQRGADLRQPRPGDGRSCWH